MKEYALLCRLVGHLHRCGFSVDHMYFICAAEFTREEFGQLVERSLAREALLSCLLARAARLPLPTPPDTRP